MRIAVFGAGGLGGVFASQLIQAEEQVALIARGEHLKAIQQNGLILETDQGDIVTRPQIATENPTDVGVVDLVILGTKMDALQDAIAAVRPMIGPQTGVLTIQNGLEAPLMASEAVGA